jgi:hypothetical protein
MFVVFVGLTLTGCASTLPSKGTVQNNYSIVDAKTFSSVLDCESTKVEEVESGFAKDYCHVLGGDIKLALQKELSNLTYNDKNPDLVIQTTLEEINGGSAAARLWVGWGAGRSITTIYVKVIKRGNTIAEQRITETTAVPNLVTYSNYSNGNAILQDAPLVAHRIAEFVKNPANSEKNNAPNQ